MCCRKATKGIMKRDVHEFQMRTDIVNMISQIDQVQTLPHL